MSTSLAEISYKMEYTAPSKFIEDEMIVEDAIYLGVNKNLFGEQLLFKEKTGVFRLIRPNRDLHELLQDHVILGQTRCRIFYKGAKDIVRFGKPSIKHVYELHIDDGKDEENLILN